MCKESTENNYVVTYSDEKIVSKTGLLTIQNRNDFDIAVSLHQTSGEEEKTVEIKANGVTILHNIEKNKEYTLGCHADVKEGTEIKIMVYDGEKSEPYQN